MRRNVAVIWHAAFSFLVVCLYFFFVIPRWFELRGVTPHVLGTVLRIVVAVLIALAALPVALTLLRTRKPEYGTPQLALRLLVGSIVAHLAAGVLILGAAISEIWLSLDQAGPVLFGIYGAAAAIAVLGIAMFYLSFVAEMPPPPPKPLTPKKPKAAKKPRQRRSRTGKKSTGATGATEATEDAGADGDEAGTAEEATDEATGADEDTVAAETGDDDAGEAESAGDETAEVSTTEAGPTEPESTAVEAEPLETASEQTEEFVSTGGRGRHEMPSARKASTGGRHKMPTGKRRGGRGK